jgi:hypothetical protein
MCSASGVRVAPGQGRRSLSELTKVPPVGDPRDDPSTQVMASADNADVRAVATLQRGLRAPVAPGERACCCPSHPAVRVVLPPTPQRDHAVDLLLAVTTTGCPGWR